MLLQKIFAQLRAWTNRDFSRYKRSTILRRIARRMQLSNTKTLVQYVERLRESPDAVRALADDLLITVTHFFRDTEVFEKLESGELAELFARKNGSGSIRAWSVGCATGEEAYSLAMLLVEEAGRHDNPPQINVFASDLHSRSLDQAREGFYPGDITIDVRPERLERFFVKENSGYRIRKEIRELVIFAPHNLLADPPFSKLDLISCRNLLIYLEREVQQDVIALFHYALNPDGTLLLGSAETMDAPDLFRVEDKRLCLFRKRNGPPRDSRLPVFPLTHPRFTGESANHHQTATRAISHGGLHQRMVERYAPPSFLVAADDRIVHFSENVGRYLITPGGEPTTNAVKMIRDELRIDLQSLLRQVREKRAMLDSRPIAVRFNGSWSPVVLHLRPSREKDEEGFVLVILEERESRTGEVDETQLTSGTEQVQALQGEINQGRRRLQTVIEEYEASREEMKASNEELQSANEELRSTMEELETSKEELQSINEELQTVNQQNRHKVEELAQLSSDLQNLMTATDIATLFLDRNFRILRFTPKLGDLFNIRSTDRGRPIADLTHRLAYPELHSDAESVLLSLIPGEREVQADAGRWYAARIHPYRSTDDRIEGVVVTFIDIHTRKVSDEALVRANVDLKYFSYAVSHDMQEPLRMVLSYTQLLARSLSDTVDPKSKQYIAYASDGAKRMESLLTDLRQYWSVDEPKANEQTFSDSNKVLDRALEYLETRVEESGVLITRDQLPVVAVESYPLTLLFQNLLGNAMKYLRPGVAPYIRVSAIRQGAMWDFTVADNGMGIAPESLEEVFAPFKRLHGGATGGTGLGLAMCRKIVERYRGRIWAASNLGQGTTFHFSLPALESGNEESTNTDHVD